MTTKPEGSEMGADVVHFQIGNMRVVGAASTGSLIRDNGMGLCAVCCTIVVADVFFPHNASRHGEETCRGSGLPTGRI